MDPWFQQPLWLSEQFGDHAVWAYNAPHASWLRSFVAALHRERGAMWIRLVVNGEHRGEVWLAIVPATTASIR